MGQAPRLACRMKDVVWTISIVLPPSSFFFSLCLRQRGMGTINRAYAGGGMCLWQRGVGTLRA